LALTVEPGEKATPAKLREAPVASALNSKKTFSATISSPMKSDLVENSGRRGDLVAASSPRGTFLAIIALQSITQKRRSRSRNLVAGMRDTRSPEPTLRLREISLVDLEADKPFHAAALRRHS